MNLSTESQRWNLFNPNEINKRWRAQMIQPPLGLRPFFASDMARLSAGCASDGLSSQPSEQGFHSVWQRDSHIRKQTRAHGFHIVADIVCF